MVSDNVGPARYGAVVVRLALRKVRTTWRGVIRATDDLASQCGGAAQRCSNRLYGLTTHSVNIGVFLAERAFRVDLPQLHLVSNQLRAKVVAVSVAVHWRLSSIFFSAFFGRVQTLRDPYVLCPDGSPGALIVVQLAPQWEPNIVTARPRWTSFVMGSVNSAVVRRSQLLRR